MAPSWPLRGPFVAPSWPRRGPVVAPSWPPRGPLVAPSWPLRGPFVAPSWPRRGPSWWGSPLSEPKRGRNRRSVLEESTVLGHPSKPRNSLRLSKNTMLFAKGQFHRFLLCLLCKKKHKLHVMMFWHSRFRSGARLSMKSWRAKHPTCEMRHPKPTPPLERSSVPGGIKLQPEPGGGRRCGGVLRLIARVLREARGARLGPQPVLRGCGRAATRPGPTSLGQA